MVLVHGVAGSNLVWEPVVAPLEPHYTVLRPDLLGYGRSPKPRVRYTPRLHVDCIRLALEEAGVAPPYVLVGLSMGVNLVLEYACAFPDEVDRAVGIGFPYYSSPLQARSGVAQNLWTRLAVERPIVGSMVAPPTWWLGRLVPGLTGVFSRIYTPPMAKDALRASYRAFRSSLLNCMVENPLDEKLRASASLSRLFLHGSEDRWCTVEDVSRAIAGYESSSLVVVEEGAHNLVVTKPDRTVRCILEYLGDA